MKKTVDSREVTRAVIARADDAISELEHQLSAANQRMQNAVQEVGSIPGDRQRRSIALSQAREEAKRLETSLARATALAKLYADTPAARAKWDDVEKLRAGYERAQTILLETEETVRESDTTQAARETELRQLIETLTPSVVSIQSELEHMRAGREVALRELAEQDFQAILAENAAYDARIAEIEADYTAARQDKQAFIKAHISQFRSYRDLDEKVRAVLQIEDAHTRVIESMIAHLELFLAVRTQLKNQLPVNIAANPNPAGDNWTPQLCFSTSEWFRGDWRRNDDTQLSVFTERLQTLHRILNEYRTYLAHHAG